MIGIVDTHQHLIDRARMRMRWIEGSVLDRDLVMPDYLAASADAGVTDTVYMEVDCDRGDRRAEVEYVSELCEASDNPMRAAVVGGFPADDDFAAWVAQCASNPWVRGMRSVLMKPGMSRGTCLSDAFVAGVRLLGECGLSFDLCHPPALLSAGAELAALAPDTLLIVDHCGNADPYATGAELTQWRDGIRALADQPNTVMKISGIVARAKPGWTSDDLRGVVEDCIAAFGDDRCVFGGDWPVCTLGAPLADWCAAARGIIAPGDQQAILHDNAHRIYRL